MLDAPSTRLMSQSMPASKASTLAPLAVMKSSSSRRMWTSWAMSARKTSPVPETFISCVPSLVTAFLIIRPMPPEPACSNVTLPWWATIEPSLASIVTSESSTFKSLEF